MGVRDLERETKGFAAEIGMRHREGARREPVGQSPAQTPELQEIPCAAKLERFVRDANRERHADTAAEIFLKTGRTGETFAGGYDLWKTAAASGDAGPDLAANRGVFGHGDDHRNARFGRGRQWRADQAHELRQAP